MDINTSVSPHKQVLAPSATHITEKINLMFLELSMSFELVTFVIIVVEDLARSILREEGFILDHTEQT